MKIAILNCENVEKLAADCERVLKLLESQFSTLHILLTNEMSMSKAALRKIKYECIQNDIAWEIKRACDNAIYDSLGVEYVRTFC